MSGRECMEIYGTSIVRKHHEDAWADGTFTKIQKENPEVAIIKDCRGQNEVLKRYRK